MDTDLEKGLHYGDKKYNSILSVLIPRRGFIATAVLIYVNIVIFILMAVAGVGIFMPDTLGLLEWGADFGPLTLTGDWWRTFTCNFVHISIFHLVMNMYALLFISLWLEPLIGTRRMFFSYTLTGLCSAACSLLIHSDLISAGASGSIFGLYGIFLAFLFSHRIEKSQRQALLASILVFVGYNLLNGMQSGIDNAAHVGGLVSGLMLGYVYVFADKQEKISSQRLLTITGEISIFLLFAASIFGISKNIPSEYKEIREEWNSGAAQEYLAGESTGENGEEYDLPPYQIATNKDWYNFIDTESSFACKYPSNWTREEVSNSDFTGAVPPLLVLTNGLNSLTITKVNSPNKQDFDGAKEQLLKVMNEKEADYEHTQATINGIQYEKILRNMQAAGTDGTRYEVNQLVLYHFPVNKEFTLIIQAMYNDDRAKEDLDNIIETIRL